VERHGIVISLSIPRDMQAVLKAFDELALLEYRRRKGTRSKLILRAMKEYVDHHYPGNPQTPLFDQTRLHDPGRIKAAINFLRFQRKLSIRKISKIVGLSKSEVHRVCERVGFDVQPLSFKGRFPYDAYRERLKDFMAGRYATPREAFTF